MCAHSNWQQRNIAQVMQILLNCLVCRLAIRIDGSVRFIGNTRSCVCVCVYYVVAFLNTYTNHLLVAIIACWPIAAVCLFVFGSFQRRLSLSCESREPKIFIRFDANTTLQPICVPYHLNGRSF